jgi:phage terminase large subunit
MKKKTDELLSPERKSFVRKVVSDPVLFATHILGVDLWQREAEILRSIKTHRRTAVKACHGVGKTFTLAVVALWWLARYPEGIVLTTSPTQRQVRTQLWSEIHRAVERAKVPYPKLKTTELKFRDDNNFAIGFSTNQSENFQGYHGKYVLIIADEAPGIESGIWDAVAGTMAGGVVHIVMAGNPTVPSGAFFDAFTRERGLWNCFTISVFDSPNLKGITLEQLLAMDPAEGGPLDQNAIPFMATKRWVYDQYLSSWHGDESSSPNWLSRVLAKFPDQAQNALIKLAWLERAKERAGAQPVEENGADRLTAGVDVGGGDSETVVCLCSSAPDRHKVIKMGAWRGSDTRGEVVSFLSLYRSRLSSVRVDSIGIGYNFGLHLRDQGFPVELINVGMPCEGQSVLGDNDPAARFVNQKAQFYQNLADIFERDEVDGLTDDLTLGQLAGLLYEIDGHGRLKIESKEKARLRGVASPDRAEALMLALGRQHRRVWPNYMLRELADVYHRDGMSEEQIAGKLDATVCEVRGWQRENAKREREAYGIPRKVCAYAHCSGEIEFGTPYTRQRDLHYHVECARKAMFGPFAA